VAVTTKRKRAGRRQGSDRLAVYRAKRHFDRTPEPRGGTTPPAGRQRFVVQRHRARRLHYDFRLEVDGVLVSWAVPKGPTLDPKARRMAVHVEDHPVEYFDFEGVIPAGEYGGGDVIVWDWGTWTSDQGTDLARAVAAGDVHVDLHGEKLQGRFVLVRREDKPAGKDQWLLLHKRDDHAVAGWNPEDHPASVKSGRTNDEVAADPELEWHSDAPAASAAVAVRPAAPVSPQPGEIDALAALGDKGTWRFGGRDLRVTNLDKVLYAGRGREREVTKREVLAYHAAIAPYMLPYLAGRPVNLHRYPDGATKPGFWHKAHPQHAPGWVASWDYEDADPGETQRYTVIDSPSALVWVANYGGAIELHPWTSTTGAPQRPTWAFVDIDPGERTTRDDLLLLATLHRTALDHLGLRAMPKLTGRRGIQVWIPIACRYTFDETRAWVERLSRAVGDTVPDLVSWEWHKDRRQGLARLDYTQNAINKTLVAPFSARPAPGAPVSVPVAWDELDDPDLRPDRWTIRTVLDRLDDAGDPLRSLIGSDQLLPAL
jgi:bifunctional non-homologous end joining protein LigD